MASRSISFPFAKMHGLGNDFVIVDNRSDALKYKDLSTIAKHVCNRYFGIGSDGLILLEEGTVSSFLMRMFNPDGSESEACGNGLRCFAQYLCNQKLVVDKKVIIETKVGIQEVRFTEDGQIEVDMGTPALKLRDIPMLGEPNGTFIEQPLTFEDECVKATGVSMGNPHIVIFVEDVEKVPLNQWGPVLEHHPLFPRRTNVHFVQVLDEAKLIQRTWERGAGITLACGSGACAVGVAAFLTQRTGREVRIQLPGGNLDIFYQESGNVLMKGPAVHVFDGHWCQHG